MPVEKCGNVGRCMAHPNSYKDQARGAWHNDRPKSEIARYALQRLEEARAKDVEIHTKNELAISNNKMIRERVEAMMATIGMPKSWSYVDQNSQARYPKRISSPAGYLTDLDREVPVADGFENGTYERLKKLYEEYAEEGRQEAERIKAEQARAAEREREARLANVELAEIILRHGLDRESDWEQVLEALTAKDQRLNLAVAMRLTRADWSEGAYRVEGAMRGFKIETTEDSQIATCVSAILGRFEDGRQFRDCEWSYDTLFKTATDQQLSRDVQVALKNWNKDL